MNKQRLKVLVFRLLANKARLQYRATQLRECDIPTILNLHRVCPRTASQYAGMEPELFDQLLGFLKEKFHLCTISELGGGSSAKPKLVISFDDGYQDFWDYAVPLLERHKVPANQNVIPDCIEKGHPPVNVWVQDFIGLAPRGLLAKLPLDYGDLDPLSSPRKHLARHASFSIKYLPEDEYCDARERLLRYLKNYEEFLSARVLTRMQVCELSTEYEIGAHSFSHLSMAAQEEDVVIEDARKCKHYFNEVLGFDTDIYAFPNGSATAEQQRLVQAHGFNKVLLVGDCYSKHQIGVFHRFTFSALSLPEAKYKSFGRSVRVAK